MNTPGPADHRDPSADETAPQAHAQEPVEADTETETETETDTDTAAPESAAVFLRRRGGPSLTFWVMLCLAVPAVATLVIAPLLGVSGLTAVLTVTLTAAFGIGVPLAGLCAVIDAIVHRKRR